MNRHERFGLKPTKGRFTLNVSKEEKIVTKTVIRLDEFEKQFLRNLLSAAIDTDQIYSDERKFARTLRDELWG